MKVWADGDESAGGLAEVSTRLSPRPSSRMRSAAQGLRRRTESGPCSMMNSPPPGAGWAEVKILPPQREEDSRTVQVTGGWALVRYQAVASPVMPPPTMATCAGTGTSSGIGDGNCRVLVDEVDEPGDAVFGGVGGDAVAEVEDVAGAAGDAIENGFRAGEHLVGRGQESGGVEVALDGVIGTRRAPRREGDRCANRRRRRRRRRYS